MNEWIYDSFKLDELTGGFPLPKFAYWVFKVQVLLAQPLTLTVSGNLTSHAPALTSIVQAPPPFSLTSFTPLFRNTI